MRFCPFALKAFPGDSMKDFFYFWAKMTKIDQNRVIFLLQFVNLPRKEGCKVEFDDSAPG